MRPRLLLLVCASLIIAAWPIGTSSQELSPLEVGVLAAALALVVAVQCALLWAIERYAGKAADAALVLLAASNAYHFAFVTVEAPWYTRVAMAGAFGLAVGGLSRANVRRQTVLLFTAVFVCLGLGQYGYERILPADAVVEGALKVNSDRNVYLISTESLHSPYAFRRLYDISDIPHINYLKDAGFRILDQGYSADMSTRASYQRILGFSKFLRTPQEKMSVFRQGNATFTSFMQSGYDVQFIYKSNYLDVNHKLVTHGYPGVGFYICDHLSPQFYYFVCLPKARKEISRALFDTDGSVGVKREIEHLLKRIRVAAKDPKPWLTISHVAYPRHTAMDHRYDNAAEVAAFRELPKTWLPDIEKNYRDIVGTIKDVDPNAVIVTFGDHGTWLTRGMDAAEPNAFFDAEDFVEDRYGVLIGVYPADFCRNRISERSTTSVIVKSVIQCLNGDDTPTQAELEEIRSVAYKDEFRTVDSIVAETAMTH